MKDYEALSRAHFDRQAAEYDARDTWYWSRQGKISCRDIDAFLANRPFETILDVGCATGYLAELLAARRPVAYTGLDIAAEMVRVASAKNIPGATFVQGAADRLPFADASFDVVACSQSFHHYPRQDEAMREALRVLRPGGLYVLSDTGWGGPCAWFDNHVLFPLLRSGDFRVQSRRSLGRQMVRNGFDVIASRSLGRMIYTVVGRKLPSVPRP